MGNARKTLRPATNPAAAKGGPPSAVALAALECVPDAVVVVDTSQHVVFVNQHVVHRFGFATAELVGQPLRRLVPDSLRDDGWRALAEILQRKRQTAASIQASISCKDGALRGLSIDVGLLEIDGAAFALCLLRDAEPAQSPTTDPDGEASLREAQRIAKLGSWTWDVVGDQHWWSDELYRMLQIDRAEKHPFARYRELIHPGDRAWIDEGAVRIARGDPVEPRDVRIVLPDGAHRILHSIGAATVDASGRVLKLQGTLQDVTEQRAT
jgi:PAS domain S-box-containing protein